MRIGVLAVQGSFSLHINVLRQLGVETVDIRRPEQLSTIDGIIIPGGESTTMAILFDQYNIGAELKKRISGGLAAWGTCAGAIMLGYGKERPQPRLALINIEVTRNAYGRQIDSFMTPLDISGFDNPFPGVFIRAPVLSNPGPEVEVLAAFNRSPVMARQDNILVTTFHPELTADPGIHWYFLTSLCAGSSITGEPLTQHRQLSRVK